MSKNLLINSFNNLSKNQRLFGLVLVEKGGNIAASCKEVKICPNTYYKWYRDNPTFRKYQDYIVDLHTEQLDSIAYMALKTGLEKGDMKAVRTYYELRGKLKSNQTKIDNTQVKYNIKFGQAEESEVGRLSKSE